MLIDNEALIGKITPTVYIDKITLESPSQEEGITVTLNLVVKDKLDGKFNSTWFGNANLSKFVKIKVIQTTDNIIHSFLSNRNNAVRVAATGPTSTFDEEDIIPLMTVLDSSRAEALSYFIDNTVIEERSLATPEGGVGGFVNQYKTTDNDGNIITDFNYRVRFELDQPQPNLSYFAFSYIDFVEFQRVFDITLPSNTTLELLNGKVSSDIVFETRNPELGPELVSLASAFYDKNNVIWPGPVHKMSDGAWMTGFEHTDKSKVLTKRQVPNTKIQDFRIFNQFEKIQYDLSILDFSPIKHDIRVDRNVTTSRLTTTAATVPKILNNDDMDVAKKQSYFSNAWVSRSEANDVNFIFAANMQNIIKYKGKFGRLIENSDPSIRDRIFELTKIKSFRVDRKRVKDIGLNELGSFDNSEERFDDIQESDEMIAITGEVTHKQLLSQDTLSGFIEEVEVATPHNGAYSKGCRYFSVSDRQLKDVTYGLYQYGTSMMIEDGTILFLKEISKNLKKSRKSLKQYLEEISNAHNIRNIVPRRVGLVTNLSSYNPLARKLTNEFRDGLEKRYPVDANAPWQKPITEYLYALQALTNSLDPKKEQEYATLISRLIDPATGNVEGINAFIAAYDKMLTAVQDLLGKTSSLRSGQGLLDYSTQSEKKSYIDGTAKYPAFIECQHWFSDAPVDAEDLTESGISYLITRDSNSFRIVPGDEFFERIKSENEKFYNADNADISIVLDNTTINDSLSNTDFSYLSPSFINTQKSPTKTQFTDTLNYDNGVYKELESAMINNKQKAGLADLIANNGITITKFLELTSIPIIYQVGCEEVSHNLGISPSAKAGIDMEIALDNEPSTSPSLATTQALSILNLEFAKSIISNFALNLNTIANFDISNTTSPIFSSENSEAEDIEGYLGLPNQFKSIFKASITPDQARKNIFVDASDFIKSIDTSSLYEINWSLIQKIEFLDGFEENKQEYKMVKAERWETLTRTRYNSIKGKFVLCRTTPFFNDRYNIKYNKDIELPIYNRYFLLQVPYTLDSTPLSFKERLQNKLSRTQAGSVSGEYTTTN
tara:strand:- start:2215 stop:5400 length:3186 start_codon:yes stop_codon:yes gene_type:complete